MTNTPSTDIPLHLPTDEGSNIDTSNIGRKSKKRDKPHIPLAPNQPPTTQGKPRERVYVACAQCRSRKVRCDGAKPCHNCTRRVASTPGVQPEECSYDPIPKRRGPDKTPGSRQKRTTESGEPGGVKRRRRRTSDTSKPTTTNQLNPPIAPRLNTDLPSSSSITIPSLSTPVPITAGPSTHSCPSSFQPDGADPGYISPQVPTGSLTGYKADTPHVEHSNYPYPPTIPSQGSHGYVYDMNMVNDNSEGQHHYSRGLTLLGPSIFSNERVIGNPSNSYYDNDVDDPHRYLLDEATFRNEHLNDTESSQRQPSSLGQQDYPLIQRQNQSTPTTISYEPSVAYTRKTWWDALLFFYDDLEQRYPLPFPPSPQNTPSPTGPSIVSIITPGTNFSLPSERRALVSHRIRSSILSLFKVSNYWFSFFHAPTFLQSVFSPTKDSQVQPALIYAFLAVSEFLASSELERGRIGRERSLKIRDEAQSALERSWNSGWLDEGLAQAAWLLAFFEVCSHDQFATSRTTSAMMLLDAVIRSMNLIAVDQTDPSTNTFPRTGVPILRNSSAPTHPAREVYSHGLRSYTSIAAPQNHASVPSASSTSGCSCASFSLGGQSSGSASLTPLWLATPAWSPSWSLADIRKESCRRLCWSTMILAAGHLSYTTATWRKGLDLYVADPANYALLFSGEAIARPENPGKETVWALYDRAYLLWHGCMRMRVNDSVTPEEKARFGVTAWLQADELERKLNLHTCNLERGFLFQGREFLFNTRMCVSYEFQSYIPEVNNNVSGLFQRHKAEQWLSHQKSIAETIMTGLHNVTGLRTNMLFKRPFFIFGFMGSISRALQLWECDRSMVLALECSKAMMAPINYLAAAWPCTEQRIRHRALWDRLSEACYLAGVEPPPFPDYSVLDDPKTRMLV